MGEQCSAEESCAVAEVLSNELHQTCDVPAKFLVDVAWHTSLDLAQWMVRCVLPWAKPQHKLAVPNKTDGDH